MMYCMHAATRSLTFRRFALRQFLGRQPGFSLVELLVVVVVLGIFSAIALESYNSFLRRERVNAVALALYGWLSEVRQASLRLQDDGCVVSFQNGVRAVGQELAKVQVGSSCASMLGIKSTMSLDRELTNGLSAQISTTASSVSFTPRTLTTNTSDLIVGIIVNTQSPQRCVRISAVSGFIQLGRNNLSSDSTAACAYSTERSI